MAERQVSVVWVLSAVCWIVGAGLLMGSDMGLGRWAVHIGFVIVMAGVTLSIRGFFFRHWESEITAFRLGEKAERERHERAPVRALR